MNGKFSFPSPPPPPPKPAEQQRYTPTTSYVHGGGRGSSEHQINTQTSRGRGGSHGFNGRQAGGPRNTSHPPRPGRASFEQSSSTSEFPVRNCSSAGNYQRQFTRVDPVLNNANDSSALSVKSWPSGETRQPTAEFNPRSAAGHKRKLEALRGPAKPHVKANPTVPATPSFESLPPVLRADPATLSGSKPQAPSSRNRLLGLTPNGEDPQYSSSETDDDDDSNEIDEEALYAEIGDKLTFEHNGTVTHLSSQADLIAWKQERQRRWPTAQRAIEKELERQRVSEERRRLLNSAALLQCQFKGDLPNTWTRNVSATAQNVPGDQNLCDPLDHEVEKDGDERQRLETKINTHDQTLEELRKKVLESEARNRKAVAHSAETRDNDINVLSVPEEAQAVSKQTAVTQNTGFADKFSLTPKPPLRVDSSAEISLTQNAPGIVQYSSEDDSDDEPPEEFASKQPAPTNQTSQRLCRYYSTSGSCRDGSACPFRHIFVEPSVTTVASSRKMEQSHRPKRADFGPLNESSSNKTSILDRLKEQDREGEVQLALQVIMQLGATGFFQANATE